MRATSIAIDEAVEPSEPRFGGGNRIGNRRGIGEVKLDGESVRTSRPRNGG